MKWLLLLGVLLWSASAFGQAQGWSSDQDGMNFALADVGTLQVNDMAGTGTRCAAVDSTGAFLPMSVACNAGTVTSVSATAPLFITGGASPTPNVVGHDLIFGGASTTGGQNLGSISTAPLGCVTSGGDCVVDGLTLAGGLRFDTGTGTETLANSSTCGTLTAVSGSTTSGLTCSSIPGAAANGAAYFNAVGVLDEDAANYGWNDAGKFWTLLAAAAPVTPSPGKGVIYVDSTSKNIVNINDAGVSNHGIRTKTCASSSWVSAVADNGISTCSQPAFSDVSGSVACGQLPAFTGDTHSGAGSCALVTDHLTDGGGNSFATSGTFATGQPLVATVSGHTISTSPFPTKLVYSLQLQLSNNVPNTWLLSGGTGLFTNSALIEYPNDFQASNVKIIYYLRSNVITAGTVTFQASRNGSGISGTSVSLTSASGTGVTVGTAHSTGSSSSSDTYGLFFSTDVSYADASPTSVFVTVEMILTP